MKVRATVRLGLLAAIIAAAGILMGCGGRQKSLPKSSSMTVSIVDRLSIFVSSLNGDRSDTSSNLDPGISTDSTADRRPGIPSFLPRDSVFIHAELARHPHFLPT